MLSNSNFLQRGLSVFLGFLVLAAVMVVDATEDLEGLRVRAEGRWAALIAGDFDQAYGFETPGYRELYTAQQYRNRYGKGLRWQQARVVEMELKSPKVASVTLEIEYSFHVSGQGMMSHKGPVTETWVRIEGQWWYQFQ